MPNTLQEYSVSIWTTEKLVICAHAVRVTGYSKWPSSKAAASEDARRTLRYVEVLNDARTPLAGVFSILLNFRLFQVQRPFAYWNVWGLLSLASVGAT